MARDEPWLPELLGGAEGWSWTACYFTIMDGSFFGHSLIAIYGGFLLLRESGGRFGESACGQRLKAAATVIALA